MPKTSQVADKTKLARTADDPTMVSRTVAESPPAARVCSLAFTLLFHGDSEPAEVSWASEHPAILMLADLLPASGATLAGDSGGVLLATVETPLAALVLATRVQKLVESYTRHPSSGLRGVSIAIASKGTEGDRGGPPASIRAQAQPGQILVVGEMRRAMEALPGVRLRKAAAQAPMQSAGQRQEIHELIFPYTIPPAAKVSRTMAQAPAPVVTAPKPDVRTAERASAGPLPVRRVEPEEDVPAAGGGRRNMILGAAAVVVLAAIGIGVKMSSKPAAAAPVAAPAAVETASPTPPVTSPATTAAKVPAATRVPVSVPAQVPAKPAPVAVAPPVAEPRPTPATKPEKPEKADKGDAVVPMRGSAFTAEQLRSILDKAEQYAADGHYDQAIRNFDQVLANDPGNQRAKQGRERARTNKEMQQ